MLANAEQFLRAVREPVFNDGANPFLWPHFPGFHDRYPFACELVFGETWRAEILDEQPAPALAHVNFYDRIRAVVALYRERVATVAGRLPKPDMILCCIPQRVIDECTVSSLRAGEMRRRLPPLEKRAQLAVEQGFEFLFREMDPRAEDETAVQSPPARDQSRQHGVRVPTQLIWPRTLDLTNPQAGERRDVQDLATGAWNLLTGPYHKAGGVPWRLAQGRAGDVLRRSFYREVGARAGNIRTSLAQAFTTAGDGYELRGQSFEWNDWLRMNAVLRVVS